MDKESTHQPLASWVRLFPGVVPRTATYSHVEPRRAPISSALGHGSWIFRFLGGTNLLGWL